jgi:hypothetical protein
VTAPTAKLVQFSAIQISSLFQCAASPAKMANYRYSARTACTKASEYNQNNSKQNNNKILHNYAK